MKINIDDIDEQNNPSKIYLPENYYKIIPSQHIYHTRKNYNNYQNVKSIKSKNLIKSNIKTISSDEEKRSKYNYDYLNQKIGNLYLLTNSMIYKKQKNQLNSNYSANRNLSHFQQYRFSKPLKNLVSSSVICENRNPKNIYNYFKKDNNFTNNNCTDYNYSILRNRYKSSRNNNKNIFLFNNIKSRYINYDNNQNNDVRHSSSVNKMNHFISHSPVGRFDHYFVSSSIKQRQLKLNNNVCDKDLRPKTQKQFKTYNAKNFQIQNNSNLFFGSNNDVKINIEKNNNKFHNKFKKSNNILTETPGYKKETYENDDNNYYNLNNFKSVTVNNLIRESFSNNDDRYFRNNSNENNNVINIDEDDEITFKDTKNNNKNITKNIINDYINVNNIFQQNKIKSNYLNSMLEYETRISNTENNEENYNIKKLLNNDNIEIIVQYNNENNITNLTLNDNKGKKINFVPISSTKLNDNNDEDDNKKNIRPSNINIKKVFSKYSNSNKSINSSIMQLNDRKSGLVKKNTKKKLDLNKVNRKKYPPPVTNKRKKYDSKEKGLTFNKCSPKKNNFIDKSSENKNTVNFNNFMKKKNFFSGSKNDAVRSMSTGEKNEGVGKKNEKYNEEIRRKKALKNLEKFFAENPIEEENDIENGNNINIFKKNRDTFKMDKLLNK